MNAFDWMVRDSIVCDSDAWREYMDSLDQRPRTHAGRLAEAELEQLATAQRSEHVS